MVQAWDESFRQLITDRYEILRSLGKRTGRRTLLARDLQSQNLVVIKLLLFDSDFEWSNLKLFEREAAVLKLLDHPAIPRYLDYFDVEIGDRKGFALVQTYIEAKSLEEHLKAGRSFTEAEIKQIAIVLLEILRDLHDRHPAVIHRDIKPSNILLGDRSGNSVGQVYLVDFGAVQAIAAKEDGTMTIVGTYGYMPPEQFGGRATPASDLYSLGATLIYLMTGQNPSDLPQKNLRIEFHSAVDNASPGSIKWLQKMVEPSVENRFASAKEAIEGLEQSHLSATESTDTQADAEQNKLVLQENSSGELMFWFRIPKRLLLEKLLMISRNILAGIGLVFLILFVVYCLSALLELNAFEIKYFFQLQYVITATIGISVPGLISTACFAIRDKVLTPLWRKVVNRRNKMGEQVLDSEIMKLVVFPPNSSTKPKRLQLNLINGTLRLYPGLASGMIDRDFYNLTNEELLWVAQEISNKWDVPIQTIEQKSSKKRLK